MTMTPWHPLALPATHLLAFYWPTHAMPLMLAILCLMAIAYRYYSAFLAARVAVLDDSRRTPALRCEDGQNFEPTSKWVLFGHHFAAISGAGPLIGPVLAAQFGYMPGLLWIVVGVCLGGAVQDFLVLAASIRRGGKSLAEIAREDIGAFAGGAAAIAILFILIIALAGLGKVVVKALGGEEVKYPAASKLVLPSAEPPLQTGDTYAIPAGTTLLWGKHESMIFNDGFMLRAHKPLAWSPQGGALGTTLPPDAARVVPGSAWGTFTIACTIPIALLVGFYMYRVRKGRTIEASILGGALTLAATFAGGWVAQHSIGQAFNLSAASVTWLMALYGFVAAVLPVWVLLCPRDYISSFLKIGTIIVLVAGTLLANPKLEAPAFNSVFAAGGPTVPGNIFPFLFITIMCGAISGFHALVSSGTTPKMITRESHARTIGYGAMLIEGLVGVVAMIAAATLPVGDYYAMNTDLDKVPAFHDRIVLVGGGADHLHVYEQNTRESLRGRTGGAVTLAVGMAHIFDQAAARLWRGGDDALRSMWKYWYHFAIMFEALFILTTIDAGTRIGRFLLQEVAGRAIHPKLADPSWWPGALASTALIVLGWVYFINSASMADIWPMFGIANQMLAVIALAVVSAYLANEGRARYLWVTTIPLVVVATTTTTAAFEKLTALMNTISVQRQNLPAEGARWMLIHASVQAALIGAMLVCGFIIVAAAARRVAEVTSRPALRREPLAGAAG